MKMNPKLRKALTLILCAMTLVAISVGATVAYLASADEVVNTFTVGHVTIDLDEALVDENGKEIVGDGADRVEANAYQLFPGHVYDKDPTVHVTEDSEDCYVFVELVNEIVGIEADTKIAAQILAKGWIPLKDMSNDDAEHKIFYKISNKGDEERDLVVFENFTILGSVDNDTLNNYKDAEVKITAYAIQLDGFAAAADADEAAQAEAAKKAWNAGQAGATAGGWTINTEDDAKSEDTGSEGSGSEGTGDEGANP